jgi:hypothetical protein
VQAVVNNVDLSLGDWKSMVICVLVKLLELGTKTASGAVARRISLRFTCASRGGGTTGYFLEIA